MSISIKQMMVKGLLPNPYEITMQDVLEHNRLDFGGSFGFVIKCDVGKRVFLTGGIIQMENDEQVAIRRDRVKCNGSLMTDSGLKWAR
jgi:hypothetical protein